MAIERFPYGEAERLRLYRKRGDTLTCLATAPDGPSIGCALTTLHAEGEWGAGDRVGILEKHRGSEEPGRWLISPYGR